MITRNTILASLALAACGGDRYHGTDAPPLDVAADTLGPESGNPDPNAVVLFVTALGIPAPNVPVVFQNPDSTLVSGVTTDDRGMAWATVQDGGFVTAIEPPNATGAIGITTFAAVEATDRLHLDLQPVDPAPQATVTFHVPIAAGATGGYLVHNSCGEPVQIDTSGTGSVTFSNCGNGTIDVVVTPLDSGGDATLGALYVPAVSVIDGGSSSVAGTYDAFVPTTFTYTNVPSTIVWISTYQAILTARGRVYDGTTGVAPVGTGATTALPEPHTPGGTTVLTVSDGSPIATEFGEQLAYTWGAYSTSYSLDVTAQRLGAYAVAPAFDVATRTLSWTEGGGGMTPSFVRAQLRMARDAIPSGTSWTWRMVAPRAGTSLVWPHLPSYGFDFNPAAGDTIAIDDLTNALLPGGYDAIRAHGFAEITTAISGTSGTILVEVPFTPAL